MYYEDLSLIQEDIRAVGWLERGRDYNRGAVEAVFIDKLLELLLNPWQPAFAAGFDECDFCRISHGPRQLTHKGRTLELGCNNLYVPGRGCLYLAPSLLAHYMDAHEYSPPQEFCKAVTDCPPMRSVAYFKALIQNGGRELVQRNK